MEWAEKFKRAAVGEKVVKFSPIWICVKKAGIGKGVKKHSFGDELGLGGSVWGLRLWKLIVGVLGSL